MSRRQCSKTVTTSGQPLGIFWDIDNCRIPLTTSPSAVVDQIRNFIARHHPECSFPKEFYVTTDARHLSDSVSHSLTKNGVVISHVAANAKNAADDKLQEHIDTFLDYYLDKSPVVVIITGDTNFAKTIRSARKKDIVVVLIYGDNCSKELKSCSNEAYSFENVIHGVEEVADSCVEPKTTFVKVSDLPKDKPIKDNLKYLSRLLANCGSKPVNYVNGMALVKFGCLEDALRACQRFNGCHTPGKSPKLQLINEELNDCPLLQEFNICKSVIKGLPFKKNQVLKDLVLNIIKEWNDPEINEKLIASVDLFDDNLIVTAVTPGANQKLISCAERHLKPEFDIECYETIGGPTYGWCARNLEYVSDDRRSVIKGLNTYIEDNVTNIVKELVDSWNDPQLSGDLIVSVERNTKTSDTDIEGKSNLFVTAINADASKALVKGAKHYLKNSEPILKWTPYKHKFQASEDCLSVIKGLNTNGVQNITKFVRDIVNKWNDPYVKGQCIVLVERNTQQNGLNEEKSNLFVTATTPQKSRALIKAADKYIKPEHNVRWTEYVSKSVFKKRSDSLSYYSDSDESQCSYFSTTSSISGLSYNTNKSQNKRQTFQRNRSNTSPPKVDIPVANPRMSIITGLSTRKEQNVLKLVRKLVSGWKESYINGNLIEKVERDPSFALIDGKIPLFVTAFSPEFSQSLIKAAKRCLDPNSGIKWTEFGTNTNRSRSQSSESRPPLLPFPPFPPNFNPIVPHSNPLMVPFISPLNSMLMANPFAQQLVNPLAQYQQQMALQTLLMQSVLPFAQNNQNNKNTNNKNIKNNNNNYNNKVSKNGQKSTHTSETIPEAKGETTTKPKIHISVDELLSSAVPKGKVSETVRTKKS